MSEKRLLAILGLILGLLSALLILIGLFTIGRRENLDLQFFLERIVGFVFGVAILLGSLLIYRGKYRTGGLVNFLLGVVALVLGFVFRVGTVEAVLAIISGILGLLAADRFR